MSFCVHFLSLLVPTLTLPSRILFISSEILFILFILFILIVALSTRREGGDRREGGGRERRPRRRWPPRDRSGPSFSSFSFLLISIILNLLFKHSIFINFI